MNDIYYSPVDMIFSLAGAILPLIVFLASAYYLSKKKETASILLAVGSFLNLFSSISFIIMPRFVDNNFYTSSNYSVISGLASLGNIAFAIGFVMLILKVIKEIDY